MLLLLPAWPRPVLNASCYTPLLCSLYTFALLCIALWQWHAFVRALGVQTRTHNHKGGATPSTIGSEEENTHHSSTQAARTDVHAQRQTGKRQVDGPAGRSRSTGTPTLATIQSGSTESTSSSERKAHSCCVIQSTATTPFCCLSLTDSVPLLSTTLPRHHMGGRAAWHSCMCLVREYEICRQHLCGIRTPGTATHTHPVCLNTHAQKSRRKRP